MAKKKTIRTIPQERTPMREQDPQVRAKNFEEVACGYSLEDALRESERCLMCPDEPCIAGCPVGINIPGFIQKIGEKNFRGAYDILTDTNLLPSICGRVCPQENQCEGVCTVGESLEAVAIGRLERFVGDTAITEGWVNIPYIEPNRLQGRHRRLGAGRHGLRGRHGQGRLRRHGLRGLPSAGRRAALRHSGFPPAQRGDRRRDRQPEEARRQVRMQHPGRPPVHHRADDRRDGLPRGLRRRRRRLSDHARHSRRFAERRALGERTADALQPDARQGIPELRHAAADRQARRRGRRRQHGDGRDARVACGWARKRCTASTAARAPRPRRAPRKSITPSRKASSSTGSPTRWRSSTTARAACAACAACAWNWASPTIRAGAGRFRSPAANSISKPI